MKRSRRVVLTMMGTAAVSVMSGGLADAAPCGPGFEATPGFFGLEPDCRPLPDRPRAGFGGAVHRFHDHAGG